MHLCGCPAGGAWVPGRWGAVPGRWGAGARQVGCGCPAGGRRGTMLPNPRKFTCALEHQLNPAARSTLLPVHHS